MPELGDSEPFSREGAVIAAIGAAFAPADSVLALNTRQTTACGGVALSSMLTNRLAVKEAMRRGLPMKQNLILWYRYGKDKTQLATAQHFHLSVNDVRVEEAAGLQQLVRLFWADPGYISPPRTRRPNPLREWLAGLARASA